MIEEEVLVFILHRVSHPVHHPIGLLLKLPKPFYLTNLIRTNLPLLPIPAITAITIEIIFPRKDGHILIPLSLQDRVEHPFSLPCILYLLALVLTTHRGLIAVQAGVDTLNKVGAVLAIGLLEPVPGLSFLCL